VTEAHPKMAPIPLQANAPIAISDRVTNLAFAGRYVPAGPGPDPIAGDFYDVLHLEHDLVGLVVGDVTGHGAQAALRMQQLRAATRAYALDQRGPARLISRLDRFLDQLDTENLATLWYGEYEPSTGRLLYASAGHPPPALAAPGLAVRFLTEATTPPLGIGVSHLPAEEAQDHLEPGALLVAYSDGLVERRGESLDDRLNFLKATLARICAAGPISPADTAMQVMSDLVPDPKEAGDDVCLLVVRREL
jgi:sigma-B regulation protein RsbU (phosphoserine phosphatase)